MARHVGRTPAGQGHRHRARWHSRDELVAAFIAVCCAVSTAGCGSSNGLTLVAGVVRLDGAPLDRSAVTFRPTNSTGGPGGIAITDASGRFVVYSFQGKKGLAAGTYKVTVSQRKSTTSVTEDIAVADSDLVEHVPAKYSDPEKTELTATIGPQGDSDLRLELSGRPNK